MVMLSFSFLSFLLLCIFKALFRNLICSKRFRGSCLTEPRSLVVKVSALRSASGIAYKVVRNTCLGDWWRLGSFRVVACDSMTGLAVLVVRGISGSCCMLTATHVPASLSR